MQSQEKQPEIKMLENQLKSLTERFDIAIVKDIELGEVKKIFHELKVVKTRLQELEEERIEKEDKKIRY